MLANQALNTRSNSKIIVYNISLPNKNGKLGSKNQRGICIFFCPGADETKVGKPGYCKHKIDAILVLALSQYIGK
jgi:hypothetical protein